MKQATRWISRIFLPVFMTGLISCSQTVPPVSDPDELIRECTSLTTSFPDGLIVTAQWPSGVKTLNPVSVEHRGDAIIITTFQQTGEGVRGYIVDGKAQPVIEHYTLTQKYPGVYSFEFVP